MNAAADPDPVRDAAPHRPRLSGPALAAVFLALCLLPLALALARPVAPADPWEIAAAGLGLVALAIMAMQFVTSGRFETVSGRLGIDRIMAFHKMAAWWVLLALVLHPLLLVWPTWSDDPGRGIERMRAYLSLPHYRSGVVAWAGAAAMIVTAALRDRLAWRYEVWRATHVGLALLAVAAGLHHAVTTGRFSAAGPLTAYWWVAGGAVAGTITILYGWRWLQLHRNPWRLASVVRRADRIWELDIQPAPGTRPLAYEAGQFVWITEGARRFPLLDHPFSIADSPLRPGLSLIIKEAGDFTRTVGQLAPGTPVGIDGPYGEFTLAAHGGRAVLLVAGGAGIGPIMGLLRDLVARRDPRPVRLAYAAGRPDNLACLTEIAAAAGVLDLRTLLLSEEDAPGWSGVVGRLDRDRLRDLLAGVDPADCVALICGPGGMVTAVSDSLLDIGFGMDRVIYERFDYSAGPSRLDRQRRRRMLGLGAMLSLGVAGFVAVAG